MMEDPPALRRINGFTWPFHIHQILSWLFLLAVMMNCFGILIPSFPFIHQIWLFPFGGILAILHIVFHCATVVIDPAIEQVRAKKTRETKIFRKTSGHFIVEEGYCNVCDVNLPEDLEDPHHCRRCNKCIEKMDHHCIYLNNCIGSRNYISFATCAITAFGFALFTALLSLALFIMFFLSYAEFKFFTLGIPSALWLIILVLGLIISFYIIYQVGRLLSFHLHLYLTKQTTLEFIRNSSDQFVDYSPYTALKEYIGCSKNIRPLCKTKSLVSIEPIEVNTDHAKYSRLCWKNKESPELEKMSTELCCKVTTRVKKINIKPSGGTRNSVSDDEPEEIVTWHDCSTRKLSVGGLHAVPGQSGDRAVFYDHPHTHRHWDNYTYIMPAIDFLKILTFFFFTRTLSKNLCIKYNFSSNAFVFLYY